MFKELYNTVEYSVQILKKTVFFCHKMDALFLKIDGFPH